MIEIIGTTRVQTPNEGYLLTNGESFSRLVYLGEGAQPWEEVPDDGQLEPIEPEIVE